MIATPHLAGKFGAVFDVGGNVGDFAAQARSLWPDARITSFEPVPALAKANRERAGGRWFVEPVAISNREGRAMIHVCLNQHSASTLQKPGTLRQQAFGIIDVFEDVEVKTRPLDAYSHLSDGERLLVKIDVEGHERQVIAGAERVLGRAAVVVCEVQEDREIFVDAPPAETVDALLRRHGLHFAGIADAFKEPSGRVVQFDGVWVR